MCNFCDKLILLGVELQTIGVEKPRNGAHQLNSFYTMVSAIKLDFNYSHCVGNCGHQAYMYFLLCGAVLSGLKINTRKLAKCDNLRVRKISSSKCLRVTVESCRFPKHLGRIC